MHVGDLSVPCGSGMNNSASTSKRISLLMPLGKIQLFRHCLFSNKTS